MDILNGTTQKLSIREEHKERETTKLTSSESEGHGEKKDQKIVVKLHVGREGEGTKKENSEEERKRD